MLFDFMCCIRVSVKYYLYANIPYLTTELHDFGDSKLILLNVAFCIILIFVFSEIHVINLYIGRDKLEQNENIRCCDITAICCQCAK